MLSESRGGPNICNLFLDFARFAIQRNHVITSLPLISKETVLFSTPTALVVTQVNTPVSKGWKTFLIINSAPDPLQEILYFLLYWWRTQVLFRCSSPLQLPTETPFLSHWTSANGGWPSVSQKSFTFCEALTETFVVKLMIFGGLLSGSKRGKQVQLRGIQTSWDIFVLFLFTESLSKGVFV